MSPKDQALLQHVLTGTSVIDWSKLYFETPEEVQKFLRLNEFDLSQQRDNDRLMIIHTEAIGYLQKYLHQHLSPKLMAPNAVQDLFLIAANSTDKALQKQACGLLKTMNIIHHIDGRELLYNCPISHRDLYNLLEDKVERALSLISRNEPLLLTYRGGRKPKESLITKLLSKKETIAARINDRVRYQLVTRTREDILKVILRLFETILPFNYVIPSGSVNQLISLDGSDSKEYLGGRYSGKNYQRLKFVVDIPIRMDSFLAHSGGPVYRESLGTITFVMVEFQVVDASTDVLNNEGDSGHENYKNRQKAGVIDRLMGS